MMVMVVATSSSTPTLAHRLHIDHGIATTLRPAFSSFLCGRLPSPPSPPPAPPTSPSVRHNNDALFSQLHIQRQDQLHIPGFLHLLNPPDRLSCWKARRQNACLHCFPHLARFLNSVEQLSARLRLTADRMSSLFSLSANCAQLRSKPGSDVALF